MKSSIKRSNRSTCFFHTITLGGYAFLKLKQWYMVNGFACDSVVLHYSRLKMEYYPQYNPFLAQIMCLYSALWREHCEKVTLWSWYERNSYKINTGPAFSRVIECVTSIITIGYWWLKLHVGLPSKVSASFQQLHIRILFAWFTMQSTGPRKEGKVKFYYKNLNLN